MPNNMKQEPCYVTEVAERKPQFKGGLSTSIYFLRDSQTNEWWKQQGGQVKLTFKKGAYHKGGGGQLFFRLKQAITKRDTNTISDGVSF